MLFTGQSVVWNFLKKNISNNNNSYSNSNIKKTRYQQQQQTIANLKYLKAVIFHFGQNVLDVTFERIEWASERPNNQLFAMVSWLGRAVGRQTKPFVHFANAFEPAIHLAGRQSVSLPSDGLAHPSIPTHFIPFHFTSFTILRKVPSPVFSSFGRLLQSQDNLNLHASIPSIHYGHGDVGKYRRLHLQMDFFFFGCRASFERWNDSNRNQEFSHHWKKIAVPWWWATEKKKKTQKRNS